MSDRPTPETDALECAFALLKCSPIGNPENSSEYGRAAYRLSKHCQGKEDVSEAAMRIFAERIAELERQRDEAREKYSTEATEYMLSVNKLCGERDDARNKLADALQEIDLRTLDFERMKQERDEAREQANVMHEQWLSKGRCCGNLAEELHEVKQQRDKAIARSKEWSDWCVQYMTERDEARDLADRYRVAFCSAKGDLVPQVFPWEDSK